MNGLDLAKKAVALFQENRGSESLYLQCQRFDGFYAQAAWQGNWDVTAYSTAQIAANTAAANGRVYTTDLNDSRIEAGERVYYRWGNPGHVCLVIGRDAGGLLVTNTANSGDDLGQLGNHVKISHAHTLGLDLIGVSSRDGNNPRITGVDMWLPGGSTPTPTPSPVGQDDWINLDGWYWFNSEEDAVRLRNPQRPLIYGERDVLAIGSTGCIKIRANDGTDVWVSSQARGLIFYKGGQQSGGQFFYVPDGGQYYYNKYENALAGNYDPNQMIFGGRREVVENPGTGPVRIKANDGSLIWVGTRNHPAQVS